MTDTADRADVLLADEIARLRGCLSRVGSDDVFAGMLLTGKLKAALRAQALLATPTEPTDD